MLEWKGNVYFMDDDSDNVQNNIHLHHAVSSGGDK